MTQTPTPDQPDDERARLRDYAPDDEQATTDQPTTTGDTTTTDTTATDTSTDTDADQA